ncbi:hypothetical protein KUTeg_017513 [Tegillarca granosa]|uniref:Uncharacterized protein n=1 Tax=Tegillarca granosa TaxID=220873 RepID=A0ABQ9EKK9_TEGGR|nr:hypothetical protein KUTeg_017513 [Tegillarca granosa]
MVDDCVGGFSVISFRMENPAKIGGTLLLPTLDEMDIFIKLNKDYKTFKLPFFSHLHLHRLQTHILKI